MENQELSDIAERVRRPSDRAIGVTMAIVAALLAVVTMMGHRLHTEEVVLQTKAVDGWAYYQAKNSRFHMYATDAKLASLFGANGTATAADFVKKGDEERQQAEEIRAQNEHLDDETQQAARGATFFDAAEICLEVAIVLCSIALLTGRRAFWFASFAGTAAGIAIAATAFLR